MRHPYFPNRKIRHADLLKKAGFEINQNWFKNKPLYSKPRGNVDKLIYWKRGRINLIFFDYNLVSIETLVDRVEKQTEYNTKNRANVTFRAE